MPESEELEDYEVVLDCAGELGEAEFERLRQTALWCSLRSYRNVVEMPSE
jgi:hypothetical protein